MLFVKIGAILLFTVSCWAQLPDKRHLEPSLPSHISHIPKPTKRHLEPSIPPSHFSHIARVTKRHVEPSFPPSHISHIPKPTKAFHHPRAADVSVQLVQNINTLSNHIASLINNLDHFIVNNPAELVEGLKIQLQTSQVNNDLVAAARAATDSTSFTVDESNSVAAAILALEPNLSDLLNNVVTHKPVFATVLFVGDLVKTVEQNMVQQRELSRKFSKAVTAKLASPYSNIAPLIAARIDDAFETAIKAYQACSGLICSPPLKK